MKNEFKMNSRQVTLLIFAAILEIDSLTAPTRLAQLAGPDAWLTPIFALILLIPGTALIALLGQRFPREGIIEYSRSTLGRFAGFLVGLLYAGFWTLMAAKVLRQNADIVSSFLLFRTPQEVVMIIMLVMAVYLIRSGLAPITRLAILLFPLMLFPLALSGILSVKDFDYANLFPFLAKGIWPVMKGALLVAGAFQGLEILLILMPFVTDRHNTVKASIRAVLLVWLPLLFEVTAILAVLGPAETSRLVFPTVSLIKTVDIPGGFLDRLEPLFLTGWIMAAFTTVSINFYLACLALAKLFGIKEEKIIISPLAPVIFGLAMLPPNTVIAADWSTNFAFFSLIPLYLVPPVIYVVALLRGKGEKSRREKTGQVV